MPGRRVPRRGEGRKRRHGSLAIFGACTLDDATKIHHSNVESRTYPDRAGQKQERKIELLTQDEFKNSNQAGSIAGATTTNVWKRGERVTLGAEPTGTFPRAGGRWRGRRGHSGALPRFVPAATRIQDPFIINLLFSKTVWVGEYWPTAVIDPR
jgi:hypothetical protein